MSLKKIIINSLLACVFLSGLTAGILCWSGILRDKENPPVQDNFAKLKPDSVDVIFIGTSHQFCSINPDLLYDEYGINSFMLATSAQTVPMSYYAAMEAITFQHPSAIVFEVLYCTNDFRTVTPGMSHAFFDGMPCCEAKRLALNDLIDEKERIYYYLNLGRYHNRWKDLKQEDFQGIKTMPRGRYFDETITPNWEIPVTSRDNTEEMPAEMLQYLELMIHLCRENDVKLIWYVAPFNSLYNDDYNIAGLLRRQRIFNWIEEYAAQNQIPYYNLFYELDEIEFDYQKDFLDSQHLNCYGQDKLTRYMADKGYFSY